MNYGNAIEALKQGQMVRRKGWNGKGMFVFMQVPSKIKSEIVSKMTSLPQLVKDEFLKRFDNPDCQINTIYYDNQLAIVNQSNVIQGWSPSVADCLADDWIILE